MNNLIPELYNLAEEASENQNLYREEYRAVSQQFSRLMDQVEAATSREFHETLYSAAMDYLILEQYKSFHWGLRLGLQLHAL